MTGPNPKTRLQVWTRDEGRCVRCGRYVGVAYREASIHHRRPRGMGGTQRIDTNQPQNLILLCGSGTTGCHAWVEQHRTKATLYGFLVSQWHNPADRWVHTYQGWRQLTPDGKAVPP